MMTVGELKAALEDCDEDLPVCVGIIQTYGSNFATELDDVDELTVDDWEYGEEKKVVLTQGSQIGIVEYGE
ncbi:MAG: hypothetical protein KHZ96_07645 [Coprobacillus sp.]|nr:hypothetical protein [Coprobacillus sp.]